MVVKTSNHPSMFRPFDFIACSLIANLPTILDELGNLDVNNELYCLPFSIVIKLPFLVGSRWKK